MSDRAKRPGCGAREPLSNSARSRRCLCGRLRLGLGERGLVTPNKRVQTRRRPRKGPSRRGFAGKAASRALRASAVAMATVTRVASHDLRLFRLKRAPRRVVQRFPRCGSEPVWGLGVWHRVLFRDLLARAEWSLGLRVTTRFRLRSLSERGRLDCACTGLLGDAEMGSSVGW